MSHRLLAATALSLLISGAALADETQVATLASATLKQEQILDGTMWRCIDTTCRSASQPRETGLSACRTIAKRFGEIAAYTSGDKQFTADQLQSCNQSAKSK